MDRGNDDRNTKRDQQAAGRVVEETGFSRDQRLLNWNFLRAAGCPGFFRSFWRLSRVK